MAEKKIPKKKAAKSVPAAAPAAPVAPAAPAALAVSVPEAPRMIGPGVMKRPKRDPTAPPLPGEEPNYKPSEQVFRRKG